MAEENMNTPAENEAEKLPAPKRRGGRRKKADTSPSSDINAAEAAPTDENTEVAQESQAEVDKTTCITAEADAITVPEATADPEATSETDNVASEAAETDTAPESNMPDKRDDSDATDITEDNGTAVTEESEMSEGGDVSPIAEESSEEEKNIFFEHFSDTAELTYLSDRIENDTDSKNLDDEVEQLSLFDKGDGESAASDTEPVREPKQKRKSVLSPDEKEYSPEKPRRVDARFDLIELFVFTLVVIMLITTFFFKHSIVSGPSMMSTLNNGDHLIISDFLYEPKQYDIVVIHDPEAHSEGAIVKRIVALGGQTVRLEKRLVPEKSDVYLYYTLTVYVDGVKIDESFVYYDASDYISIDKNIHERIDYKLIPGTEESHLERYEYEIYEYKVPLNEVYVLGDHRNDSKDSRSFGSVNVDKILGRVLIRIYPFADFGTVK